MKENNTTTTGTITLEPYDITEHDLGKYKIDKYIGTYIESEGSTLWCRDNGFVDGREALQDKIAICLLLLIIIIFCVYQIGYHIRGLKDDH